MLLSRNGLSRAQVEAEAQDAAGYVVFVRETARSDSSLATASVTAEAVHLSAIQFATDDLITSMTWGVGTNTGVEQIDLGLYTFDGTTYTRVAHTGVTTIVGTSGSSVQTINLTAPFTPMPGVTYYAAFAYTLNGGASITAARTATHEGVSGWTKRGLRKSGAWSSGLPATITAPVNFPATVWMGFA
jgi:hypothetical protein